MHKKHHKKVVKRVIKHRTKKKTTPQVYLFRYVAIFSVLVLVAVVGRLVISQDSSTVLGTSTLIADQGTDDQTINNNSLQQPQPPQTTSGETTMLHSHETAMPIGVHPSSEPLHGQSIEHHEGPVVSTHIASPSGKHGDLQKDHGRPEIGHQENNDNDLEIATISA